MVPQKVSSVSLLLVVFLYQVLTVVSHAPVNLSNNVLVQASPSLEVIKQLYCPGFEVHMILSPLYVRKVNPNGLFPPGGV